MALGFSLSQSLFVGADNLVVEGVTDFWMLSAISEYLHGIGKTGLAKVLTITPVGGAQKVSYMVALLTSERLRVLVLLDDEKRSRGTRDELVKSKLIRDDSVIFVSAAFPDASKPSEADIEDLLDPDVFEFLVRESYKTELQGKTLPLNVSIPRIVKRFEAAFANVGLEFYKTRPARLLLSKMAKEPERIVTPSTVERMKRYSVRSTEFTRRPFRAVPRRSTDCPGSCHFLQRPRRGRAADAGMPADQAITRACETFRVGETVRAWWGLGCSPVGQPALAPGCVKAIMVCNRR